MAARFWTGWLTQILTADVSLLQLCLSILPGALERLRESADALSLDLFRPPWPQRAFLLKEHCQFLEKGSISHTIWMNEISNPSAICVKSGNSPTPAIP